jgi:hypothetical protein
MSNSRWKELAPYLAPYFNSNLRDRGVAHRFSITENGFPNGRSFETIEEARADVKSRMRAGTQYQIYDDRTHEWVWTQDTMERLDQ